MESWLSLAQVAQLAGCHRVTVHRALQRHELPHAWTELGRLIPEDAAVAWAESRRQQEDADDAHD